MRHPVSSAAAAAILIFAIAGVGLWFSGSGATPALADYLQPLIDAKTVKYRMIMETTSLPAGKGALSAEAQQELMNPRTYEVMELGPNRHRLEWDEWNGRKAGGKRVEIWDGNQRKQLMLYPAAKKALLYDCADDPEDEKVAKEDQGSASPQRAKEPGTVALFRSLLLDTVQKPGALRDSLGEKEIDGRRVVGFRLSAGGVVIDVWGDPKTRLPVCIETTMATVPNVKITQSDFEFNVPMDDSLFSLEPPAGYQVTLKGRQPRDKSPETEKDLTELFRYYGQWNGGRFPDVLDWPWIDEVMSEARRLDADLTQKPQAEREKQFDEGSKKLQRAMRFMLRLPADSDWHYGGKGVSIGAADTPVFWCRPKNAAKYRVIHADLSVQETDTPPSVPVVPVTQMEKDLIEMFRQHAESSGGRFPDNLQFPDFARKCLQYPPTELSEEQQRELLEARVKLQRGAIFIGLLPRDADVHYAGKDVWLGMADRPVFWYRPEAGKTYRVVYADLTVRDADSAPSMSVVQPEQGLLNALRVYCQFSGGRFPISLVDPTWLSYQSFLQVALGRIYLKFPADEEHGPSASRTLERGKAMRNIQPGLDFVTSLPPESDWHYAGWGVSRGAVDRPIFWYHPKDGSKYRVVYADLSVGDADRAPTVSSAPPLQDLIDALRYYSERSDNLFPDSLDQDGFFLLLKKTFEPYVGQKVTAKLLDENAEMQFELQPGVAFAASLPAEADAHYAGKGVSLGAADTPIFWYRPRDAKAYQVICADLSVRESDTPPHVANALPVPTPPGQEN